MKEVDKRTSLNEDDWVASPDTVAEELQSFIKEFESFTPELFVQIKFHLLRGSGLTRPARDELCDLSINHSFCPKCDFLYVAKKCLLWYRLFWTINPNFIERSPPCIKLAFEKNRIKTVASYLAKIHVFNPPFYEPKGGTSCNSMRRYGYCKPDLYCTAMATDYTLEYTAARERVKQSRKLN